MALLKGIKSISNRIEDRVLGLTSGLTVGNGDDQDGLSKLILSGPGENNLVDDLLTERSTHWSKALELDTTHNLFDLSLIRDTVLKRSTLLVTGTREIRVHEADGDAICVEESRSKGDSLQNKAQVFDATALLFKLHRSTVVCKLSAGFLT